LVNLTKSKEEFKQLLRKLKFSKLHLQGIYYTFNRKYYHETHYLFDWGPDNIETIFDVSFPGKEYACYGANRLSRK